MSDDNVELVSNADTALKDLTEMEKIVIGLSVNFVYNLIDNQIFHIDHHDPELSELLIRSESAQEEYILLQNCKQVAYNFQKLMGTVVASLPVEDISGLTKPALRLENFLEQVYQVIACNGH